MVIGLFQYILLATKILHFIGEHFLHSPNSEVRSCIRYGNVNVLLLRIGLMNCIALMNLWLYQKSWRPFF